MIEREKLQEKVKNHLEDYLHELGIDVSKNFRCLNPKHTDENPSMSYDNVRKKIHCFSCGVDYDIFDVMELKTGLHGKELFEYVCKYFDIEDKFSLEIKNQESHNYIVGDENERMVYITEGQINALSLLQAGAKRVIAIDGCEVSKLKEISPKPLRAIIVMNNDESGIEKGDRIKSELEKLGIPCLKIKLPEGYKDSNDMLILKPKLLKELVKKWKYSVSELPMTLPDNVQEYVEEALDMELARFQKFKDRKTGFSNLDNEMSLYPGLYVLGAISSLGKTTFAHQMADQLSQRGDCVLYFSLEQNKLELVTKGISRLLAQKNMKNALSAIEIRRGASISTLSDVIEEYGKLATNENIIECHLDYTTTDIMNYVKKYIKEREKSPVVIIDYLQVLRPSEKLSTREGIDANVKALKKLQSENDIVVLVISSFNRLNYTTLIDFESYKESGGIEYTADVVWGLQLKEIAKPDFEHKSLNEKREAVRKAKLANPREIELVCLKNRYGKSSYKCGFKYFAKFDLFIPDDDFMKFN